MIVTKKIGKTGGFTIPAGLRRDLGIQGGEKVNIIPTADGSIIIERIIGSCIICEKNNDLIKLGKKYICKNCTEEIKKL